MMRSELILSLCLALCLALALGCGGDDGGAGGADAGATADGTDTDASGSSAPDPGARPRPGADTSDGSGDSGGSDAGMAEGTPLPCDVAGVLEGNCIRCHGPTLQQGALMPLLTWEDLDAPAVSDPDRKVRELVPGRLLSMEDPMPPEPSPRLSAAQIGAVTSWIEAGAEPGDNPGCLLPR